jgi:Fe-S cluster assembly ATP-binding protein
VGLGLSEQRPPTIKGVRFRDLLDLLIPKNSADRTYVERMLRSFRTERFLDREINDGLSGGEIKQAELFLVLALQPTFLVLDEPDSGVDPEHLKKIARMINETLRDKSIDHGLPEAHMNRHTGLVATHSAAILDFIHTDRAHIMLNGKIKCSGNSGLMMDQIRERGYEYCITCQKRKEGER